MRGLMMPYAWLVELTPRALAYRMPYRFLALTFVGLAALTAMLITRTREDRLGPLWPAAMVAGLGFAACPPLLDAMADAQQQVFWAAALPMALRAGLLAPVSYTHLTLPTSDLV